MSEVDELKREINELKKEISELKKKIDKNTEIGRAAHFQSKGRLTELEKGYSVLKDEIKVLQQERADDRRVKRKSNQSGERIKKSLASS